MSSMLLVKDWSGVPRRALKPTEVVTRLGALPDWRLTGDGPDVAIEREFRFANYHETMAFVNAVAFVAHRQDHHPDLSVHYNRCVVRWQTHAVQGLSETDFACAALVDGLLAA
ncbi:MULTISPECIES: 4a-hydroxytetrahydrobiopterin dehydratase [Ramlibacter]|uniref:Putative pterin-4-alpha-carbinolamine dehydratase n=1 Tax=Ramlibacter pinisoli TaxID=2682844 RepID=A0A6N8IQJ8_9BURK|nr:MULTISPECIES: 4a-hydroxytetrahydrobiopterin dehydratase [Ramlibacter]MBA2963859.1 4a-hydroxytetrahydrobiopterin dehydratase [Ramlibacter sp. CGMCC 1.13660]MVQ28825.1 pterin-4-alpha-carbinolamine dehydratase [Ramlibacter pinisoli]